MQQLQQRPVRSSRPPVARTLPQRVGRRVAQAVVAACATLVALPLAGRVGRPGAGGAQVSNGVVDRLAPALPRRVMRLPEAPPASAPLTPRERVALDAPGTYIGEVLRGRDSAVVRWPERVDRPLTVWVADAANLPDWRPAYLGRVADAFGQWAQTGVPVRFRFVQDSGAAEVHVAWTDRFREPISGRTVWSRDAKWWITDANITLALHHHDGSPLDEDQVRAIALHEVGHLLGLDHTSDPMSVMAPRVRVRELSSADQATARLVYTLPAGRL